MLCSRLCKADAGESGEPPPPTPGGQSRASAGSQISLKHLAADHLGARRSSALFSHIQSLAIPALPLMPTCCNRLDLYILNSRKNLPVKRISESSVTAHRFENRKTGKTVKNC